MRRDWSIQFLYLKHLDGRSVLETGEEVTEQT